MAFEPNFEKLVSSFRKKLGTTQSVIECKLPTNENAGVQRILCVNAKAYISNAEIIQKDVNYNGYVGFQVIYIDKDNKVQSLDYIAEFRDRFVFDGEVETEVPIVIANVIDIKSTARKEDVKVVAIVQVDIDCIANQDVNALTSIVGEDVFAKNESIEYSSFVGVANEKFDIMQEVEIKDSVEKVMSVCPSVFIEKVELNNNFLTVRGGVNLDISYITEGENPVIRTHEQSFDFSQDVALGDMNATNAVQSNIFVLINELKVTTSLDIDRAIVSIVLPVMYKGYVFGKKELDIVSDVFSASNYLTIDYESLDTQKSYESKEWVEKISGNASIEESAPFMDEVLGNCCSNVVLANTNLLNGKLTVEGIAYTTVLYLNKETNTTTSVEVEMPFSLELNAGDTPQSARPIVSVSLGDVVAKGKRGVEIEINAKLFVYANFYSIEEEAVINNIVMQEEKLVDECVLNLYIVKQGDTIWDIAKEMSVSPESILEQNPLLQLPLVEGTRVVVYRQKLVQF